ACRHGADDLLEEVFLDGEGDVEVDVLLLAEVLGDLQHRLVLFLVVAAVPPHRELLLLAARHHGEPEGPRGGAGPGGGLEECPAGLRHESYLLMAGLRGARAACAVEALSGGSIPRG